MKSLLYISAQLILINKYFCCYILYYPISFGSHFGIYIFVNDLRVQQLVNEQLVSEISCFTYFPQLELP